MADESILNNTLEEENETGQVSDREMRNSSIDRLSRQSSPDRSVQSQITCLASEVKNTVMSLSDSFQGRLDRMTERLCDLQRQVGDIENRNSNSISNHRGLAADRSETRNDIHAHGEAARPRENMHARVKPQLYDGLTDIDEYLTQFNIVAEINQWSSQTKALHLASSLTGSARSLLSELDSEHSRNFSELVNALQSRFGTVNKAELYRAQLKNRLRQKGETIPELAQNIRKLTRQSYPAANSDLIDTLALDHFIDSLLDSEIRIRLRECSPKTIQEAETLAVKMEAQRIADRQRNKAVGSVGETSEKSDTTDEISKLTQTVNALMDKVENLQNRQRPRDFQPKGGNNPQNRTNFAQSRSQRPNPNFNNGDRFRGNNWPRNSNYRPGNPPRNNFGRPNEQRNNIFEQQNFFARQQGNGARSSFGTETRPRTM